MKKVICSFVVAAIVAAVAYAQTTKVLPGTAISEDFAKDARTALIAIVANPGTQDDYPTDQALAAVQVDASADEPVDVKVYGSLLALSIQKETDKIKGVAFPVTCVTDFAKELRNRNYTGLPESCK